MTKVLVDFDSAIYALASACDNAKWEYRGKQWDSKAVAVKALHALKKNPEELERKTYPEPWEKVKYTVDRYIEDLLEKLNQPFDYYFLVAGSRESFRFDVAKIKPYKGQRSSIKPYHFQAIKDYVVAEHNVKLVKGVEVDDVVGLLYNVGDIIVSIDKDLKQLPGMHYNPNKDTFTTVTHVDGLRSFYSQLIEGDPSDNIMGVYGAGAGSVHIPRIRKMKKEEDMYNLLLTLFEERVGGYKELFMLENARLLWLLRNHKLFPTPLWMDKLMEDSDKEFYINQRWEDYVEL